MALEIGALRAMLSLDSAAFEKGAKRAQASMNNLQRSLKKTGDRMQRIGKTMTTRMTAPIVAATGVLVRSSLQAIDAQAKMAESMGTTTASLQVLARAADTAGISQADLEGSLRRMTRRISLAAQGTGAGAKAFERLGIAFEDMESLDAAERVALIQERISELIPAAEQAGVASQIFGDKTGLAMLRLNPDNIASAADELERFGVTVTEVEADKIEEANDAISAIGLVTRGLGNQLAVALAPTLQSIAEKIADLGAWFNKLSPQMQRFAGVAAAVAAAAGPAAIAIGFVASGLAAVASPIGLVIVGLAAAAAGAAYVAANWQRIVEKYPAVGAAFDFIKNAAVRFGEILGGAVMTAARNWQERLGMIRDLLRGDFSGAMEHARTITENWMTYLNNTFPSLMDGIRTTIEAASTAGREIVDGLVEGVAAAADRLRQEVAKLAGDVVTGLQAMLTVVVAEAKRIGRAIVDGLVDGISGAASAVGDAIADVATGAMDRAKDILGIRSPSREFREIGRFSGEGLALGADDMLADVMAAGERLGESLGGGVQSGLDRTLDTVISGLQRGDLSNLGRDLLGVAQDSFFGNVRGWLGGLGQKPMQGPTLSGAPLGGGGLLGGLGGMFGGGAGSAFGGAGLLGLGGGSGFLGLGAGSGLATTMGAGLGGVGAAIGAALPVIGAALTVISAFRPKRENRAAGSDISVIGDDVELRDVQSYVNKRFFGLFTSSLKRDYSDVDPATEAAAAQAIQSVVSSAATLGFERGLDGFSFTAEALDGQGSLEQVIGQAVEAAAEYAADGAVDAFQRKGEELSETITRMANAMTTVVPVLDRINDTARLAGLSGADMASQVADLFGGVQGFMAAADGFYRAFYSEAERVENLTRSTTDAMRDLGFAMPDTRAQFRALVEAQDLTTESGRETFAALVGLAGAMDTIIPAAEGAATAIEALMGGAGSAADTMIDQARGMASAASNAARDWFRAADTLRDFLRDLTGARDSALSPRQQMRALQADLRRTFMAARGGDVNAARDFPGVADDFLGAARSQASTALEFRRIESRVRAQANELAGISELEGARFTLLEELSQDQLGVLTELRDYLQSTPNLDPAALAAFEGELGALGAAIEQVEQLSFANLSEQLSGAVDLAINANIPRPLRRLLMAGADGLQSTLNLAIADGDLSPQERLLAVTGISEHLRQIVPQIVDKPNKAQRRALRLALGETGDFTARVDSVIRNGRTHRLVRILDRAGRDGSITFDGMIDFGSDLPNALSSIEQPMDTLTGALRSLQDEIKRQEKARREEIKRQEKARREEIKRQEKIASLQARADRMMANWGGNSIDRAQNVADAINAAGVQFTNDAGQILGGAFVGDKGFVRMPDGTTSIAGGDWDAYNAFFGAGGLRSDMDASNQNRRDYFDRLDMLRDKLADLGAIPGFAAGGMHAGGLRIVGERGPELEATGPARYYDASRTASMIGGNPEMVAELRALRQEMAEMRKEQRQLGLRTDKHEKRSADILRKWDRIGLPQEQTT